MLRCDDTGHAAVVAQSRTLATVVRGVDPQSTVKSFSTILKAYRCGSVTGDRYAGEWPKQAFEKCGIVYHTATHTRSQLYTLLEPVVNSHQVELPDSPILLSQLIGLVRKGDRIDHVSNEHDDHANAVAGLVSLLRDETGPLTWGGFDDEEGTDNDRVQKWIDQENTLVREMATQPTGWFPGDEPR